jgi:tripeptidyl-peptidase-1
MAERVDVDRKAKRSPPTSRTANPRYEKEVYKRQLASNCSELVTPECIAALYSIPPADKANPNNSLGIFQKASWYQNKDLDLFFSAYAPNIPQGTRPLNLSIDLVVWHYDENDTTISVPDEADLDLNVAFPIIYPQVPTVFQTDDDYYNLYGASYLGIFNTFLDAIDGVSCLNP